MHTNLRFLALHELCRSRPSFFLWVSWNGWSYSRCFFFRGLQQLFQVLILPNYSSGSFLTILFQVFQIFFPICNIVVIIFRHFCWWKYFKKSRQLTFFYVLEARQDEKMPFLTRISVYTETFIRAVPLIPVRVLLLPVPGPPRRWYRHGWNFGSVRLKPSTSKSFTLQFLSEPCRLFLVPVPNLSVPCQKNIVV